MFRSLLDEVGLGLDHQMIRRQRLVSCTYHRWMALGHRQSHDVVHESSQGLCSCRCLYPWSQRFHCLLRTLVVGVLDSGFMLSQRTWLWLLLMLRWLAGCCWLRSPRFLCSLLLLLLLSHRYCLEQISSRCAKGSLICHSHRGTISHTMSVFICYGSLYGHRTCGATSQRRHLYGRTTGTRVDEGCRMTSALSE